MTVSTWNKLVAGAIALQALACIAVVVLCDSVDARAAAMIWMTIGVPCCFGFLILEYDA